jgi:hypothetical protein
MMIPPSVPGSIFTQTSPAQRCRLKHDPSVHGDMLFPGGGMIPGRMLSFVPSGRGAATTVVATTALLTTKMIAMSNCLSILHLQSPFTVW